MAPSATPIEPASDLSRGLDATGSALEPLFGTWTASIAFAVLSLGALLWLWRSVKRGDFRGLGWWQNANLLWSGCTFLFIYLDIDRLSSLRMLPPMLIVTLGVGGSAVALLLKKKFGPKPYDPKEGEERVAETLRTKRGIDPYAQETTDDGQQGDVIEHGVDFADPNGVMIEDTATLAAIRGIRRK